ncbi:UNVERIFIED_CONTAM: hypothetical protein K2H54_074387, partial [Gekko kuhli]
MAGVEEGGSPAEENQHLNGELLLDPEEREGAVGPGTDEGTKKKRKKKKKGKGAGAGQQETERELDVTLDEATKQLDKQSLEEKEKDEDDE